jgi:hypothetical protein
MYASSQISHLLKPNLPARDDQNRFNHIQSYLKSEQFRLNGMSRFACQIDSYCLSHLLMVRIFNLTITSK